MRATASCWAAAGTSIPARYGQEPTEHLSVTEPRRDAFELELVERALDRELPILGMCRGIQILNVALGGTLVQDVAVKPEWAEHPSDRGLAGVEGGRADVARGLRRGAAPSAPPDLDRAGEPAARRARRRRDRGRQLPPPGARRGRARPDGGRDGAGRRRRGGGDGRRPLPARRPVGAAGGVAGRPPLPRAVRSVRLRRVRRRARWGSSSASRPPCRGAWRTTSRHSPPGKRGRSGSSSASISSRWCSSPRSSSSPARGSPTSAAAISPGSPSSAFSAASPTSPSTRRSPSARSRSSARSSPPTRRSRSSARC